MFVVNTGYATYLPIDCVQFIFLIGRNPLRGLRSTALHGPVVLLASYWPRSERPAPACAGPFGLLVELQSC